MTPEKDIILSVKTSRKIDIIDITSQITSFVSSCNVSEGVCYVYVPHTTAAVTINENADPDVRRDMEKGLLAMVPDDLNYDHAEGNSPAHIMSSIIGVNESIFIKNRQLVLGTWQGIYFCEFDGPRTRKIHIKLIAG